MAKVFSLNEKEKQVCVGLARRSIKNFFENNSALRLSDAELKKLPKKLFEKKACFVTLNTGRERDLRGCIGHLQAIQELYKDVLDNAVSAAFEDHRFPPLSERELANLHIEVSILTDPVDFEFSFPEVLYKELRPGKDGLIIKKGHYSATFLPSVWKELPKKEDFLGQLCMKAGLSAEEWKRPGMKAQRYEAIKAIEK